MLRDIRDRNLYHGSFMTVREPDLRRCKIGKDFGRGFYLTTDRQQAINFSRMVAQRRNQMKGILNIYRFTNFDGLNVFEFNNTDVNWLHCVVGNRDAKFANLALPYNRCDVLIGKVADDNTSSVINAYMNGVYGQIGSVQAVNFAINMFLTNKLNNQFCFKTRNSLNRLKFFRSEDIWL